ncbi:leucine-rich colipase-like protein 1 [Sorex fumeus]|uniref:leucine-rich colipase-like protein 1 n=1 Tax=Sorex fumeus TaxID=62283 RepID=UPI0024ADFC3B|nr:leucine-rich colipase-like protein 1 [Sorex fumeus]
MPWSGCMLLLLLWVLLGSGHKRQLSSHKGIGEACETHSECQSKCCSTNSLKQQKFCVPQTFFLTCPPWSKPDGYSCIHHTDCWSGCCTTTSTRSITFCKPKTLFLQCLPWKKPTGAVCIEHRECESQCCIKTKQPNQPKCIKRSGILALCLSVGSQQRRHASTDLATGPTSHHPGSAANHREPQLRVSSHQLRLASRRFQGGATRGRCSPSPISA